MATIESLSISITKMPRPQFYTMLMDIRTNRRTRPEARKAAPAKTKRKPNAKAPRQQDLFALAEGMTTTQKAALAAKLMKEMGL